MPYLLFFKKWQNLKLSSAANNRWHFLGSCVFYQYYNLLFTDHLLSISYFISHLNLSKYNNMLSILIESSSQTDPKRFRLVRGLPCIKTFKITS